jgi:hypothetical protein
MSASVAFARRAVSGKSVHHHDHHARHGSDHFRQNRKVIESEIVEIELHVLLPERIVGCLH